MTASNAPESDAERFVLDVMLGKLATYLRMCGHDTAYALDRDVEDDDRIREIVTAENRTLLTRDVELADRTPGAALLVERAVEDQLQVLRDGGVELSLPAQPQRCSTCNGPVARGNADEAPEHAPSGVEMYRCQDCKQWFWTGSHWDDVRETLAELG